VLRSFIDWLDQYLDKEPSATVKGAIGLLTFASLLGALLGSLAVRAGALVAVLFGMLCAVLILVRDRKEIKRVADTNRRLVTRYCNFLADRPKLIAHYAHWEHVATLHPNGDTTDIISVDAIAMREELHFLRWNQPSWYFKDVKIAVRAVSIDGTRGPDLDVTQTWQSDGIQVFAHLHSPVPESLLVDPLRASGVQRG
jgi:hypothetical protein